MFGYGLIITALLLALAHFFPWPRRLHRLAAYVIGVGAILLGVYVWLGNGEVWRGLLVFAVVAGATTGLCYGIDWLLNLWQRSKVANHERPES